MISYKVGVRYVDEEGDVIADVAIVEADGEDDARQKVLEDPEGWFLDFDDSLWDEFLVTYVLEN